MTSRAAFYLDLLERSAWTFLQAGAAVWIALDVELFSADALKVAAVAGAIAVGKSVVAVTLPWTAQGSASTLPAEVDPPERPLRARRAKK